MLWSQRVPTVLALALLASRALASAASEVAAPPPDHRGKWFLGLTNFSEFQPVTTQDAGVIRLLSPAIKAPMAWSELVVSWNATLTPGQWLEVEATPGAQGDATRFYSFGRWSLRTGEPQRTSIRGQDDAHGSMQTDTLVLPAPLNGVRLRLTLGGGATVEQVRFLGLSFHGPATNHATLPPHRAAWGRVLEVPERSQMNYENGDQICSPTTVSMLLAYWAGRLHRPELNVEVPEVCRAVHDPGWRGWGNWAFNMAYAGSFPGLRAYATRFSDLAELEAWIAAGIPVGLSLCYNKLREQSEEPSGHLVICVGFTSAGEVVVNDGGTRQNIRKTFSREAVQRAWANSNNTVYLLYPEGTPIPGDLFGHWERLTPPEVGP